MDHFYVSMYVHTWYKTRVPLLYQMSNYRKTNQLQYVMCIKWICTLLASNYPYIGFITCTNCTKSYLFMPYHRIYLFPHRNNLDPSYTFNNIDYKFGT